MRILVLLFSLALTQNAMASTLKLNYSLFFGYMKTMYKLDYQHVTTSFYLVEQASGQACEIEQAEMVVDNKREKIEFEKQGRLLPFYSDQHRKDGAMIEVETLNNKACALQVTLMAKETQLAQLSFGKLSIISTELEGVLRKNAGMIGKYFLPEYVGLRFKLAQPLTPANELPAGYSLASNGDLLMTNEAIKGVNSSEILDYQVTRITPWIGK